MERESQIDLVRSPKKTEIVGGHRLSHRRVQRRAAEFVTICLEGKLGAIIVPKKLGVDG